MLKKERKKAVEEEEEEEGKAILRSSTVPRKFQGRDATFLKDMSHPERGGKETKSALSITQNETQRRTKIYEPTSFVTLFLR